MSDFKAVVAGVYEKYDSDKDGTLSPAELQVFYNDLVASRPELAAGDYQAWFNSIDKDLDGTISPAELEAYLASVNYSG